ncbi:hypothetical protein [Sphingomonas crusticola]|uniref:hypothetical protein n=1 Tax=Sphingomonas crusticola TaxID=1697973 RepID=UPI000E289516|nr:hypothetical protein [Sphingomonas crusticola]
MRLILAAIVIGAGPAFAAPIGPEIPPNSRTTPAQQAIALYRDQYRHGYAPCPVPTHANEVVVCGNGRGGSANRLPLPDERGPRAGPRTATGEIPGASGGLANPDSCGPVDCGGGGPVNLIAAAAAGVQLVRAIVDPEAASDHADRQHPGQR